HADPARPGVLPALPHNRGGRSGRSRQGAVSVRRDPGVPPVRDRVRARLLGPAADQPRAGRLRRADRARPCPDRGLMSTSISSWSRASAPPPARRTSPAPKLIRGTGEVVITLGVLVLL